MTKVKLSLATYQRALMRFKEALVQPKSDLARDSAILRFEFSLDLAWKTLKIFLEEEYGVLCQSPKECFRQAYQQGILEYDEIYLKLVDLRNETVHTYSEGVAEEIYAKLPQALEKLERISQRIEEYYQFHPERR